MTAPIIRRKRGAITPSAPTPERLKAALAGLWNQLESEESRRSYRADWARFCEWLTGKGVAALAARPLHVQEYLTEMRDRELAKSTRARALCVIRAVYAALCVAELCPMNPAREVKNIKVQTEPKTPWLSAEELQRMLASFDDSWHGKRDWLVLLTLTATGWRRLEVATLRWDALILGERVMAKVRVKGGKEGIVALPSFLAAELERVAHASEYVFPRSKFTDSHISPTTVWKIVKAAAARAGVDVKRATPHAIRRSFATLTMQRGVSREDRQAAMLHSKSATTELYEKGARASAIAPGEVLADLVTR